LSARRYSDEPLNQEGEATKRSQGQTHQPELRKSNSLSPSTRVSAGLKRRDRFWPAPLAGRDAILVSADARRVTDTMFMAAAKCLAELSPARCSKSGRLLPPVSELRSVSFAVAKAVALQAINDGVAGPLDEQTLESRIRANVWEPLYLPYRFDPCP
jgi:hypothetical protein